MVDGARATAQAPQTHLPRSGRPSTGPDLCPLWTRGCGRTGMGVPRQKAMGLCTSCCLSWCAPLRAPTSNAPPHDPIGCIGEMRPGARPPHPTVARLDGSQKRLAWRGPGPTPTGNRSTKQLFRGACQSFAQCRHGLVRLTLQHPRTSPPIQTFTAQRALIRQRSKALNAFFSQPCVVQQGRGVPHLQKGVGAVQTQELRETAMGQLPISLSNAEMA